MATLDDIVSVQIALQTTGVVRGDFGTPMIVAPLMTFAERVRVYTSYSAQPPSGGCVLKQLRQYQRDSRPVQPPSGGCVLKHSPNAFAFEIMYQPPSGGCVLKQTL